MASSFTIFQSAVSALTANTQALSVIGNNIANVNTPGYSRQEIVLAARTPQEIAGISLGLGVSAAETRRIFDAFAELRLANNASTMSETGARSQNLRQVESVFNELGKDGLAKFMTEYFNAYQDLSTDPTSTAARTNLLGKADTLVNQFHQLAKNPKDSQTLIDGDIKSQVDKINSLAAEIVDLNGKIKEASGSAPNLRDQRTLKVRELSNLIDTSTVETSEGTFQVYIAGGMSLVTGATQATVSTQADTNNSNLLKITFAVGSGASTDITSRVAGGSLKGNLTTRDTDIPLYQKRMNELAYEITNQVNTLHKTGYNLSGNTGLNFFSNLTNTAVSTDLATNLRNASGTHLAVQPGNVITIAGTIGAAFSSTLTVTSTTTMADIASAMQTALRAAGNNTELAAVQADGSIKVTSGATAITGLTLSISGNTTFNTALTYPTPIAAAGGTGSSILFKVADPNAASNIDVDSSIKGIPTAIAAAGASSDVPGGNSIAVSIGGLQTANIAFSTGSASFTGFYGDLLSRVGNDSQSSVSRARFAEDVFRQAEIQRERISGVSLNEEQTNLIRYQAAFQAASKLVAVADEILNTLVKLGT